MDFIRNQTDLICVIFSLMFNGLFFFLFLFSFLVIGFKRNLNLAQSLSINANKLNLHVLKKIKTICLQTKQAFAQQRNVENRMMLRMKWKRFVHWFDVLINIWFMIWFYGRKIFYRLRFLWYALNHGIVWVHFAINKHEYLTKLFNQFNWKTTNKTANKMLDSWPTFHRFLRQQYQK